MKINYVEHSDGTKLFSFYRHDYKTYSSNDETIMIDGGFSYSKHAGKLEESTIEESIKDIREQFVWGRNYDKDMNHLEKTEHIKLRDLDSDHIVNILIYFTKNLLYDTEELGKGITKEWCAIHEIFLQELKYRNEN